MLGKIRLERKCAVEKEEQRPRNNKKNKKKRRNCKYGVGAYHIFLSEINQHPKSFLQERPHYRQEEQKKNDCMHGQTNGEALLVLINSIRHCLFILGNYVVQKRKGSDLTSGRRLMIFVVMMTMIRWKIIRGGKL